MWEKELDDIRNRIESVELNVEEELKKSSPEVGKEVGKTRRILNAVKKHLLVAQSLLERL